MKASAIIVAAGSGSRLGRTEPKAFVKLREKTLLSYSLAIVSEVNDIHELVVAVPRDTERTARREVQAVGLRIPVKITSGGAERQDSVRLALALTSAESDLIIIHDAARPFATADLFRACLETATRADGAIAAVPVTDTLKRITADYSVVGTVARANLWQAQTPQAFRRPILIAAHERALRDSISATDDADLVEQIGGGIEVIEPDTPNLKITWPSDLLIAEALAAATATST